MVMGLDTVSTVLYMERICSKEEQILSFCVASFSEGQEVRGSLFVCVEVLRPSEPNRVMSSVLVYLTTL